MPRVFFGWTATYAIVALIGIYWIEIQVATPGGCGERARCETTDMPSRRAADRRARGRDRGLLVLLGVLRRDRRPRLHRPVPRSVTHVLDGWSLDPSFVYVALAGGLYVVGSRDGIGRSPLQALRVLRGPAGDRDRARLADRLLRRPAVLGAHAPARPAAHRRATADPARAAVAANVARAAARAADDGRARRSLGRAGSAPLRALARPVPAWILFNLTFVGWHLPCAYDLTLTNGTVHALEHAMFFFTGLLFWARVIDPGPLRPRLVWPARIAYVVERDGRRLGAGDHAGHRAARDLRRTTPQLANRPGGISALTDQQLAGRRDVGARARSPTRSRSSSASIGGSSRTARAAERRRLSRPEEGDRLASDSFCRFLRSARCSRCCCQSLLLIALRRVVRTCSRGACPRRRRLSQGSAQRRTGGGQCRGPLSPESLPPQRGA